MDRRLGASLAAEGLGTFLFFVVGAGSIVLRTFAPAAAPDIPMGGPLTGAAMNPARWFGPAVASGFLDNWIVWIAGPLLGAGATAVVYRWLFAERHEDEPEALADVVVAASVTRRGR